MSGHIFFREKFKDPARADNSNPGKRKSRWAFLKDGMLSLYKSYRGYCTDSNASSTGSQRDTKVTRLEIGMALIETHRERDEDYGFYVRVRTAGDRVLEIWADTLREYELWLESFGVVGVPAKLPEAKSEEKKGEVAAEGKSK